MARSSVGPACFVLTCLLVLGVMAVPTRAGASGAGQRAALKRDVAASFSGKGPSRTRVAQVRYIKRGLTVRPPKQKQQRGKVKMPLARDSIMLGVNQGIIMVLSVVVIGCLVGSGALGDMVARGLQRNEFG